MTRRKTTTTEARPANEPSFPADAERDDFATGRALTRKQVVEMVRKKESFEDADLRGCDLAGVSFDGADLSRAKFAEANLSRCSFRGARLVGASFFGANLKDAVLDEADLEDADLDYAFLDGVTLWGAKTKKAIFPAKRILMADIKESVRSGRRLTMEPLAVDDD